MNELQSDSRVTGTLFWDRHQVTLVLAAFMLMIAALLPGAATAHEIRPAIATLGFGANGGVELKISLNLEVAIAGIGTGHDNTDESAAAPLYNRLRALPAGDLSAQFEKFVPALKERIALTLDDLPVVFDTARAEIPGIGDTKLPRISLITLTGPAPDRPRNLAWRFDPALGDSVIRLSAAGGEDIVRAEFVPAGQTAGPFALDGLVPQSWPRVFTSYLKIGFVHIMPKGLDHILFVVGLFLLSARLKTLLWQVTSFTLAHSVSLALGTLGIVQIPTSIVEPLIAASIVYVAIENILTDDLKRWRPFVVFGFGLLHGLGFAGVLAEIGLSQTQFLTGLVAFNMGVELGQLTVIAFCFVIVGLWFQSRSWYRNAITIPASTAIAFVATYWFIERVI